MTGHKAAIFALAPGSSDRYFLSAAGDGWVVRWDLAEPELGKLIARAESGIFSLLHLPAEELVIAGNRDGGIHWIDLQDDTRTRNISHHQKGVFAIYQHRDFILTLGGGGTLSRWSLAERRVLESFQLTHQSLRAIDYHEGRNELAISASDHHIYILDAESWSIKHLIRKAHDNSVFTLRYSPDGNFLLSGGRDAQLKTWVIERDFELSKEQPAHWFTINDLVYHPQGHLFATASRDKTIKIWDSATFQLLKVLETARDGGHLNSVNRLYWSNYNNYLISCSDDRSIIIWDIE